MVTDLTHLKDDEPVASPIIVTDLTHLNDDGSFDSERPRKRRSRFDIVGERNPSSMYEYYPEDGYDPYAPPPPRLLPESMFTTGLPSIHISTFFDFFRCSSLLFVWRLTQSIRHLSSRLHHRTFAWLLFHLFSVPEYDFICF